MKSKSFPDDFKIARVTPIFKGDDTEDLGNYRPISILASTARIYSRDYCINSSIIFSQQIRY